MHVKLGFMGYYKGLFGSERDIELESGAGLLDLAQEVCTSQECYQTIFDESGKPRRGVVVEKNGRRLQLLHEGNAKLSDKDSIIFFHSISV
jgi:hypothetical protein